MARSKSFRSAAVVQLLAASSDCAREVSPKASNAINNSISLNIDSRFFSSDLMIFFFSSGKPILSNRHAIKANDFQPWWVHYNLTQQGSFAEFSYNLGNWRDSLW